MTEENANASTTSDDNNLEESDAITLTLNDVLDMENEIIDNAAAVLGASNDKNCSYSEGYLKRQALYSCLTCIPEARNDPERGAGICLACSYHCHEGHELIELYTKRNFRCDCGNSKFNGAKCNLFGAKSDINELNSYNQNFGGMYCTCHRPYPDPEDPVVDEMIQCILCEDWFHSRHLGVEVPTNCYEEMICRDCVAKHEFLLHYNELTISKVDKSTVEEENSENVNVTKEALPGKEEANIEELVVEKSECNLPKNKNAKVETIFFPDILWRARLCHCDECTNKYLSEKVNFLIDSEDPVHFYEEKGKAKAREAVETRGNDFINSLSRFQLGEVAAGYNDLKQNLAEYLKKFAENKKVVREEDIKEFFEGMNARKKQKVDIPYLCH